jgi:hypothetical protein
LLKGEKLNSILYLQVSSHDEPENGLTRGRGESKILTSGLFFMLFKIAKKNMASFGVGVPASLTSLVGVVVVVSS